MAVAGRPPAVASYATAPTPGALHDLDLCRRLAGALGWTLLPWQEQALRVITERGDDGTTYRHPQVLVSVPRQSGKSTLLRVLVMQRLVQPRVGHTAWLAQTRLAAALHMRSLGEQVEASSALAARCRVRRGVGYESVHWRPTGSSVSVCTPTGPAMHGLTLSTVLWDEVWAFDDLAGEEVITSAVPAMATRPDRQIILTSTAGDHAATFLRTLVERGRAGDMALLEWAAPDRASVDDLRTWPDWHPAYGATIDRAGVLAARRIFGSDTDGWHRSYGNVWPPAREMSAGAVSAPAWHDLYAATAPAMTRPALGLDVDDAGMSSSAVLAWPDGERVHVGSAMMRPGAAWLVPHAQTVVAATGATVWSSGYGPCAPLVDALVRAGVEVTTVSGKDESAAAGAMVMAVRAGRLSHDGCTVLGDSVTRTRVRPYGDGILWARRGALHPSSPVGAATMALWGVDHAPPVPPRARIISLSACL
jgi:hypothetical protein